LALAITLLAPVAAQATNGYQLIGVGSYQKSLAGAVTANSGFTGTSISLKEQSAGINLGYRWN
jgi:long-chain fatty acid transport protein